MCFNKTNEQTERWLRVKKTEAASPTELQQNHIDLVSQQKSPGAPSLRKNVPSPKSLACYGPWAPPPHQFQDLLPPEAFETSHFR